MSTYKLSEPENETKITSYKLEMNKTNIALLNETWFQKGDKQLKGMLESIEMKDNIHFLRRDRNSRGGGVAIAFDRSKAEFKKVRLESLRGKDLEIVAAAGKLTGIKKNHVLVSIYLPPMHRS